MSAGLVAFASALLNPSSSSSAFLFSSTFHIQILTFIVSLDYKKVTVLSYCLLIIIHDDKRRKKVSRYRYIYQP